MIRVTIELLKYGNPNDKELLGCMEIWNNLTGTRTQGNYQFRLFKKHSETDVWKTGSVENFPRQKLTAYDLVYRCLKEIVGDRNL